MARTASSSTTTALARQWDWRRRLSSAIGLATLLLLTLLATAADMPRAPRYPFVRQQQQQQHRTAAHHIDDLTWLQALHTSLDVTGGGSAQNESDLFAQLHTVLTHMHRHRVDDLPAQNLSALFAPMLDEHVVYVDQARHGQCVGRVQVIRCLLRDFEEHGEAHHKRQATDGSASARYQLSTLRQNSAQVTRVLESHRLRGSAHTERVLDVYFVHYAQDITHTPHSLAIVRLEKMLTIVDPVLFDLIPALEEDEEANDVNRY